MFGCAEKKRLTADVAEAREACMIAIKFLSQADAPQIEKLRTKAEECLELYKAARERLEQHVRKHRC
jgi:hypothetical protein